jgi:tetrapyrrole methylase family protein/MazG family protein
MIYIVGLGPGDPLVLPPRAKLLLERRELPLFLRTQRHPTLEAEPIASLLADRRAGRGSSVVALDDEYERGATFEVTYEAIVSRVMAAAAEHGEIVYAVPGHPLVGESTVARLLPLARERGITTRVVGAPSFVTHVWRRSARRSRETCWFWTLCSSIQTRPRPTPRCVRPARRCCFIRYTTVGPPRRSNSP